jgi:alginate O-acetyltransferase complex protein AlgI
MYFNSLVFLLFSSVFFPVYLLIKDKKKKILFLFFSCLVFYGFYNLYYLPLIIFVSSSNYYFAIKINGSENPVFKKRIYFFTISLNLIVLFLFKYLDFFGTTFNGIFSVFGVSFRFPFFEFILPAGISFYIFLNISYIIEVYRQTIPPESNFIRYVAFSSFWPSVMAGPILRARNFLVQFNKNRSFSWEIFYRAFFLISVGFFKKVFIADNIAAYVTRVYDSGIPVTFFNAWSAAYAYTLQIYFDFSGYSDIAIGCALIMGFRIPDNFNFPYASANFTEFWRRWHISLSNFLRDYLFLPFSYSGFRKFKSLFPAYAYASIITMLLAGLWHGASWNFILWGMFHGIALTAERGMKLLKLKHNNKFYSFIKRIIFFNFLTLSWVLFRNEIPKALNMYSVMLGFGTGNSADVLGIPFMSGIVLITLSVLIIQYYFSGRDLISYFSKSKNLKIRYAALLIIIWVLVIVAGGTGEPLLYFKF